MNIEFPDHYAYTNYDIKKILKQSKKMEAKIITTEKDFYRLEGRFNEIQVIKSELQILDEIKLINSILKKNENN
jgi:tetraacyldisaccharide 4'-kinase